MIMVEEITFELDAMEAKTALFSLLALIEVVVIR
jgi:hypothetical protein